MDNIGNIDNEDSENYTNALRLSLYKKINEMTTEDLFFLYRIIDYIEGDTKGVSDNSVVI